MTYAFLILAVLCLIPGIIVFFFRPDLRPVIGWMGLFSLPFALTEGLFYGDYWEPAFLFGLVERIGFGIEDLIFVVGLAAFSSTAYAVVCSRCYLPRGRVRWAERMLRLGGLIGVAFALVAITVLVRLPMIYGAIGIMALLTGIVLCFRRDLVLPALSGALITGAGYTLLCGLLALVIPDVFTRDWHTVHTLNVFLWKIPLEEILYGLSAGGIATVLYPWGFDLRLVPCQGGRG